MASSINMSWTPSTASPSGARRAARRPADGDGRADTGDVAVLDRTQRVLEDPGGDQPARHAALAALVVALGKTKRALAPDQWEARIRQCRQHPVCGLLHQDPFTRRAFSKPRGYAGDAVMLDFIYGREDGFPLPEMSPVGRAVFDFTTSSPAPEGVRARRAFVAALLDRLAEQKRRPDVLSVAAGHFREANLSIAVRRRQLGRVVALDADEQSLEEVARYYGKFGVTPLKGSVRELIAGKHSLGGFDLVYSTGLFDYLGPALGRRLLRVLFDLTRPGGRVLVANFLPGIRDEGYMEAYMDWRLVYRSRREMIDLTMEIPEERIQGVSLFAEDNRNIIFLEVRRRGDDPAG